MIAGHVISFKTFKIKSHDEQTGGGSPEMIGDGYEHG